MAGQDYFVEADKNVAEKRLFADEFLNSIRYHRGMY